MASSTTESADCRRILVDGRRIELLTSALRTPPAASRIALQEQAYQTHTPLKDHCQYPRQTAGLCVIVQDGHTNDGLETPSM